jgi:hypothetical protein
MDQKKSPMDRRHFLLATGVASTVALAAGAVSAAAESASCNEKSGGKLVIKGLFFQKPEHLPAKYPPDREPMGDMPGGPGGQGNAQGGPGGQAAQGNPGAQGNAQGGPGGPGGQGGPPGGGSSVTSAILIEDGKYLADKSKTSTVTEGKITDKFAKGVKVSSTDKGVGGVYVKGVGTEFTLADASIELDGEVGDMDAAASGAAPNDYATLILRNCTITSSGKSRMATSAHGHSTLKVYNSTLRANGVPFKIDFSTTAQKTQLEVDGNTRAHVTVENSYSYFYYSTIISEGWGALSTDGSDGFVYLEANHCTIKTLSAGYGTYSDSACHNVFNSCTFDVAGMAAIMADESDITFTDVKARCGSYFALIHNVGTVTDIATLKVLGGEISTKKAAILTKSANADILIDGAKLKTENGVLIQSTISKDPGAKKAYKPTVTVLGIHATFKDMDAVGDILHDDHEARPMTIYLEEATLKGAVKGARLSINRLSKWFATADSTVTLAGDTELAQIDAPAGVTITATAAGGAGTYKLASCGTLIVKTA